MVAERLLQSVKALEKFEKAAEVDIVEVRSHPHLALSSLILTFL